jgi:hypothetical protein
MAPFHPSGISVEIVGITSSDRGRSCEAHTVCGSVLKIDSVVRFRAEQIDVDGKEETALAVYWVTDGVDRCKVGFLPRHLVNYKHEYDGKTAQIVEFLEASDSPSDKAKSRRNMGVAIGALVEATTATAETKANAEDKDPHVTYIDRAKRTPTTTKKRSTPRKDKDIAKKRKV